MQLGMIGLGRMGANMVRRLIKGGHQCVVYDRTPKAVERVSPGQSGRLLVARGFCEKAAKAPSHLADGSRRDRGPVPSTASCPISKPATF